METLNQNKTNMNKGLIKKQRFEEWMKSPVKYSKDKKIIRENDDVDIITTKGDILEISHNDKQNTYLFQCSTNKWQIKGRDKWYNSKSIYHFICLLNNSPYK